MKTLLNICFRVGVLLCAMMQASFATVPVSLNIYPTSFKVAYGATAQTVTLQYYVVSNVPEAQTLSNYVLTALNPPANNPITVTNYRDDCKGVLPAQGGTGVCNIFVTLSASGNPVTGGTPISPINYTFSFNYSTTIKPIRTQTMTSPQFPISFATGQQISSASRTFEFKNNCGTGQNIWLGIAAGAAQSINPDPSIQPPDAQSCLVDTDCYPGSKCHTVSTTPVTLRHCFWKNPPPLGGVTGYEITPTNSTTVTFPVYDNGIDVVWSGGIAARTGCTGAGASCVIADCGGTSGDGTCAIGQGFQTPNTTAEFTLQGQQALVTNTSGYPDGDTYDITVINGATAGGLSMAPINGIWGGASNPYVCGTPGSATANSPLGACDWTTMTPPAAPLPVNGHAVVQADYIWVATGGSGACPSPSTPGGGGCTSPQVCGHTISGSTVDSGYSCGTQLGLLTADAICAKDASYGAPFDCASTVTENSAVYTYAQIYGCAIGDFKNSCYSSGASAACCGCQNWASDQNYPATIPSSTQTCNASNSNWKNIVLPSLSWVKQACPTAYVFPYDDASSTFTCQVLDSNNVNVTNYQITFCPS